jgi:hypothetical protein
MARIYLEFVDFNFVGGKTYKVKDLSTTTLGDFLKSIGKEGVDVQAKPTPDVADRLDPSKPLAETPFCLFAGTYVVFPHRPK